MTAEVHEMLHSGTIERCAQELESGLNVHRWIALWTQGGKQIDEAVAIAFYHQALQDGWEALRKLNDPRPVCSTCNDDPIACAQVPGLRHCEAANNE